MNSVARGKTTIRVDLLKRSLCLMIAGIFTFTSTIGASHVESSFWSQRQEHINRSTIKSDASPILDLSSGVKGILRELPDGSTVNFPANSGTIVETFQTASANPLVIHIQDVHNHPDAQLNEAFLIQSLLESSNFLPSLRGAERRSNLKDDDSQLLICIEGAKGIVPTRGLASLPDTEAKKEVAYSYLREGKINGEEYVALTQPADKITVYGVEDWNIYNANFAAREKVRQVSPAALAQVDNLLKQIKRAEAGKYSMELREFVSKRRAYHAQELDLATYLKFLTEAQGRVVAGFSLRSTERRLKPATTTSPVVIASVAKQSHNSQQTPNISRVLKISQIESKLDSDKLEYSLKTFIEGLSEKLAKKEIESLLHKSLALRQGSISQSAYYAELFSLAKKNSIVIPGLLNEYREYQTLHSQLSYEKLMDEMASLEENITDNLATTDEAKELLRYTDYVELLKDFWSLELTPKQWDKYKKVAQSDGYAVIASIAKQSQAPSSLEIATPPTGARNDRQIGITLNLPDPKPVEEYYKLAEARNETLAKNTLAAAKKYGVERTVLIAGGFHSDGMNKWFRSAGVPFIVIQPQLQKPANTPQPMKITFVNDLAAVAKEVKAKNRGNIASFRDLENMLNEVLRSEMGMAIIGRTMLRAEDINILLKEKIGSKDAEFTGDIVKVDVEYGSYKDAYVFGKAKYQYSAGEVIMAPAIIYGSGREMKIAVGDEAVKVLLSGLSVSAAKQIKAQAQNIEAALGVSGITELISNSSIYSVKGMLKVIKNAPQTISKIINLATERLPNLLVYSGLKDKYLGKAVKSLSGLINKDNWHRLLTKPAMVSAFAGFAVQMLVGIALGLLSNANAFGLYGENGLISWDNKNWIIGVPVAFLFGLYMLLKDRGLFQGRSRRSGGGRISGTAGSFFKRVSGWNYFFGGTGVDVDMRNVELPEEIEMPYIEYETKIEAGKEKQVPKGIANEKRKIPELLKGFFQHVKSGARNGQARGWIERKDAEGKLNRLNLPMDWVEIVDQDEEIQIGPDLSDSKTGEVMPNTGSKISVANVVNGINDFYRDLVGDNLDLKDVENIVLIGMGGASLGVKTFKSMFADNWRNRFVRFLWTTRPGVITRVLGISMIMVGSIFVFGAGIWGLVMAAILIAIGLTFNSRPLRKVISRILAGVGFGSPFNFHVIDSLNPGNIMALEKEIGFYIHDNFDLSKPEGFERARKPLRKAAAKTLFIVSDKSGTTMETKRIYDYFRDKVQWAYYGTENIDDDKKPAIGKHFIAITERGKNNDLEKDAKLYKFLEVRDSAARLDIFSHPYKIGGGYTAMSVIDLLPAQLMGVRIGRLLRSANNVRQQLLKDQNEKNVQNYSDSVKLGIAMYSMWKEGYGKMTFIMPEGEEYEMLGKWLEQLIAESLGKATETGKRIAKENKTEPSQGTRTGIFPIVNEPEPSETALFDRKDRFFVRINKGLRTNKNVEFARTLENYAKIISGFTPVIDITLRRKKDLGAFMYMMEVATAVAGYLMDVNPFNEEGVNKYEKIVQTYLAKPETGEEIDGYTANLNPEEATVRRLRANNYNKGGQYEDIDLDFNLLLKFKPVENAYKGEDNRWVEQADIDMVLKTLGETENNLSAVYAALTYLAYLHNFPHYREYAAILPYLHETPTAKRLVSNWRKGIMETTGFSTMAGFGPMVNHSLYPEFEEGSIKGFFTIIREFNPDDLTGPSNLPTPKPQGKGFIDDSPGRISRAFPLATAVSLREEGRTTVMINVKQTDDNTMDRLEKLFEQSFDYLSVLLRRKGMLLPDQNVVEYRGVNLAGKKLPQLHASTSINDNRSGVLAYMLNLAINRKYIRYSWLRMLVVGIGMLSFGTVIAFVWSPLVSSLIGLMSLFFYYKAGRRRSANYEIRVVEHLAANVVKQIDKGRTYLLINRIFMEALLDTFLNVDKNLRDAAVYLLGESVNHAIHHGNRVHTYDWMEEWEEYLINVVHDLPLLRRLEKDNVLSDSVKTLTEQRSLPSYTFVAIARTSERPKVSLKLNPFGDYGKYSKMYRFDHKVSKLIPTNILYYIKQEVKRLTEGQANDVSKIDADDMKAHFELALKTFHNGNEEKMYVALLREKVRTDRSLRDILLSVPYPHAQFVPGGRTLEDILRYPTYPRKETNNMKAETVVFSGGGENITILAREMASGQKRKSIPARGRLKKYDIFFYTHPFDSGGHSGRMAQEKMDKLGLYMPAPGDPGAVQAWLTDIQAYIDAIWGVRLTAIVDKSDIEGLKTVLGRTAAGTLISKRPDFKEGVSWANLWDVINNQGLAESVKDLIAKGVAEVYDKSESRAEKLLEKEIGVLYEKYFGTKDLPLPENWHYVVFFLLNVMRYWDQRFFRHGDMRLVSVSVVNLVHDYAETHDLDLNKVLGIFETGVKFITKQEADLAGVLEAHTVRIGDGVFLVRAKDGQLQITPAQEIDTGTGDTVEGERGPRPIGTTRIYNEDTWTIRDDGTLEGKIARSNVSFVPQNDNSFIFMVDGKVFKPAVDMNKTKVSGGRLLPTDNIGNGGEYYFNIGSRKKLVLQKEGDKEKLVTIKENIYLEVRNLDNGLLEVSVTFGSRKEQGKPVTDMYELPRTYDSKELTLEIPELTGFNVKFLANPTGSVGSGQVDMLIEGELQISIADDTREDGKTIVKVGNSLPKDIRTDALWDGSFLGKKLSTGLEVPLYFKSRLVNEQTFISDADDMLPARPEYFLFKKAVRGTDGRNIYKEEDVDAGIPVYDRLGRKIRIFEDIAIDQYPGIIDEEKKRIAEAFNILLGHGSLFDSVLPHLMINGVIEAIMQAKQNGAHVIFIPKPTMDIQTNGLDLMEQMEVIDRTINIAWKMLSKNNPYNHGQPFHFTDLLTHVYYINQNAILESRLMLQFYQALKTAWEEIASAAMQALFKTGEKKLSKHAGFGLNTIDSEGIEYLRGLGIRVRPIGPGELDVKGSRIFYKPKRVKKYVKGHAAIGKSNIATKSRDMSFPSLSDEDKSLFNALASAVGYGLLGVILGSVVGGYFDVGSANVFSIFGYAFNALGMMAGLAPAGVFGFQAARIGWAISNAKAGHERGPGVLIPEFESAVDLPEPSFQNRYRIAQFSPSPSKFTPHPRPLPQGERGKEVGEETTSGIGVYKPAMKQLSLTEQYWYYYHEKVHEFFGRLPGQEAIVVLTDLVTWIPALWKAHKAQVITIKKANKLLKAFKPVRIGDERNLYSELGEVEKYIVEEQTRLEGTVRGLEEQLLSGIGTEDESASSVPQQLKIARDRLEQIYDLRAKFVKLGLPVRHSHTNDDDGRLSAEDLVERARANNITLLLISGHNTMEGYFKAKKYINEKGYLMDIRPAVEIDAPFEDEEYAENKSGSGPYGYMHWLVVGPNDEGKIDEMQKLVQEIDGRFETYLKALFEYVHDLARPDYFNRVTAGIPNERWQEWGKNLQQNNLVQDGNNVAEIKTAMQKWFREISQSEVRPKRWLNKLNVLGNWTDEVWGQDAKHKRRPMRDLLTMLYPDGRIERDANVRALRAEEIARGFRDIGAKVIAAHPQFELTTIKTVKREQVIKHIVPMVIDGTVQGMGTGWWQEGKDYTDALLEDIIKASGMPFFVEGSNPDYHGSSPTDHILMGEKLNKETWALQEQEPDRERHFIDNALLVQPYLEEIDRMILAGNFIGEEGIKNMRRAMEIMNKAVTIDPYGKVTRKRIRDLYAAFASTFQLETSIEQLLSETSPIQIGDERNVYNLLGKEREQAIVSRQQELENELKELEERFLTGEVDITQLQDTRGVLERIYDLRAKFISLGLPARHTHTTDDDGRLSAEELVERARANNITVLLVTGHNTMEGYFKAREYIKGEGYLMDVRPGIEVDAPFEDMSFEKGKAGSGPYGYMHWIVIGPNDEEIIQKMRGLTREIDVRLEVNLRQLFGRIHELAGPDFNNITAGISNEQWRKWGKFLGERKLINEGSSVSEIKDTMYGWFRNLSVFAKEHPEKTPLGFRMLNKLNVLGIWTGQVWGTYGETPRSVPLRELMTTLYPDGLFEQETDVKSMRAEEIAQRFTDLGAIVIVSHPDFELNVIKTVTEKQFMRHVVSMVKGGTIIGMGGGWWQKGSKYTEKLARSIFIRSFGKRTYQDRSNPDYHADGKDNLQRAIRFGKEQPWALEGLPVASDRHFKDGKFLSRRYIAEARRLLSSAGNTEELKKSLNAARAALATDLYGTAPRELVQKIYERAGEIRRVTSKGVLKTALYFMTAAALTGIMAYLFGQDTGVVKLAIPIILATMGGGLGLVSSAIGKAESGRLGKPSPEQVRKVVAELSQRFPGVVIKEAEAGKGITYEQGGDLYVNYESLAGLSPVVRQLIYSHEAMHLTNIPVVRSEFAAYLRLAIGLPMEIVKHHLKVVASQTHARLGSDVKAGLETLVALLSFRGHAYPAVDYKTVDINPDNLGIAEKVKQAAPSIDIEASKGVTGRLGEISTVLPQVVGSYLAQIGLEVKGVAVNPASLVSHYKGREVPTLSVQVIVAGPSDMKPLLIDMDTQQLNSQLSFKIGEIELTLLSDEFLKVHANDNSRNRELFVHMKSMVPVSGASFANEDQGKLYGKAYVARARTLYNEAQRTLNTTNKGLAAKAADVVAKLNELDFVLQAATGVDGIGIAANVKSLVRQAMVTGKWAPSERMLGELKGNMASAGKAIEAASRYVKLQNKLEGRVKKIMSLSAGLEDKDDRNKQERSGPGAFAVDSPVGFAWTAPWVEGMIMQNIVPQIVAEAKKGNLAIIPIVTDGDGEPLVFKTDEMYLVDDRTKKVITAISDALRASAETETDTEVRTRLLAVSNQFVLVPEENVKEANGLLNQEKLHDILLHMPALRTLGLSKEFPLHMYSPAMPGKGQRWIDVQKSYLQMFLMVTPITILNVGEHSKEAMEIYKMLAEQA